MPARVDRRDPSSVDGRRPDPAPVTLATAWSTTRLRSKGWLSTASRWPAARSPPHKRSAMAVPTSASAGTAADTMPSGRRAPVSPVDCERADLATDDDLLDDSLGFCYINDAVLVVLALGQKRVPDERREGKMRKARVMCVWHGALSLRAALGPS
jgi:hypothetical protein